MWSRSPFSGPTSDRPSLLKVSQARGRAASTDVGFVLKAVGNQKPANALRYSTNAYIYIHVHIQIYIYIYIGEIARKCLVGILFFEIYHRGGHFLGGPRLFCGAFGASRGSGGCGASPAGLSSLLGYS